MIKSPLPHPLIKQIQRDVISQRLYSDLIMIHEALIEKIDEIKNDIENKVGPRGPKGDEPSDDRIISLFTPYIPDIVDHIKSLIPELKDGHTPTNDELLVLIQPLVDELDKKFQKRLEKIYNHIPVKGIDVLNEKDLEEISAYTLKKIKPSVTDPTKILDDIMKLPQGKKIKTAHVDGLDQTISAIQHQLGKGYLHGSGVSSISAGTGITLSTSSDGGYTISASATTAGYQTATGTVDGVNKTFVFVVAPNVVVVDGQTLRKTQADGSANWTGTTSITLTVAPTYEVYGVA